MQSENIRNVAIIAHVDHGKTTLIDNILKQTGIFRDNEAMNERMMDSNDLEKERGITILAKCTSVQWKDKKINIIDTPGHADFGGEVERILNMVDGVILLVDSYEGPMPQTKFVLNKALKLGLKPIVVINKCDKDNARCDYVLDAIFDLFIALNANEDQLDFRTLYASGRDGWIVQDLKDMVRENLHCLFDIIVSDIKPPQYLENSHFSFLASAKEYDSYLGRILIGRVYSGAVEKNMTMKVINQQGEIVEQGKVSRLFAFHGLKKVEIEKGYCGDIIAIAGFNKGNVSDTIASPEVNTPLAAPNIDPATLSIVFSTNNSPLTNKNKKNKVTSKALHERLFKESEGNVTINIQQENKNSDSITVSGRGELQLSILIETMRREGYEFSISRPNVILQKDKDTGKLLEPYEEVQIDLDSAYRSSVIDSMNKRGAQLIHNIDNGNNEARLTFITSSRSLIGYRSDFLTETKGTGVMNCTFYKYDTYSKNSNTRQNGVLISSEDGIASAYALSKLSDRGVFFIKPGVQVYRGMIVGENNRNQDLEINVTKTKQLTNVRSVLKDEAIKLPPPRIMPLETAISYIEDDELIEITPDEIRLRKKILNSSERKRAK